MEDRLEEKAARISELEAHIGKQDKQIKDFTHWVKKKDAFINSLDLQNQSLRRKLKEEETTHKLWQPKIESYQAMLNKCHAYKDKLKKALWELEGY